MVELLPGVVAKIRGQEVRKMGRSVVFVATLALAASGSAIAAAEAQAVDTAADLDALAAYLAGMK